MPTRVTSPAMTTRSSATVPPPSTAPPGHSAPDDADPRARPAWAGGREPALSNLLLPVVSLFPGVNQAELSHTLSAGLAFALITFLHVVVGELAPKSIALQDPERTALLVARPTVWTSWVFYPFIIVLNGAGNALLPLFCIPPP